MDEPITRPPSDDPTADPGAAPSVLVVVVAYCVDLPHRAGESAALPDLGIERILGRGAASRGEVPVEFGPWRAGQPVVARELDVDTMSRRLLRLIARPLGIDVTLLGNGTMRIGGRVCTEGHAMPGDTILVDNRLLLYVTRRSPSFVLRHFPAHCLGAFGQPDAFEMVGESELMMRVRDEAALAAGSSLHALVLGGTGTGKEAIARAVHALSNRAGKPFIAYNGAGLSEELAQVEVFGNDEDFPNPPMKARPGLVGEAHGGTLFLDEIGELPESVQTKLLRVLDTGGQYRRVGGTKTLTSDFRMVGATNRPLSKRREDFVGRYKSRVQLPTLRARAEDIPLIAQHRARELFKGSPALAKRFTEQRADGTSWVRIAPDLLEALMMHDNPLNVRGLDIELWAAMGRSVGGTVRASEEQLATLRPPPTVVPNGYMLPNGQMRELRPNEVFQLRSRLDGTRGAVSRTAADLGISRHQLRRLMDRHGISAPKDEEPENAP